MELRFSHAAFQGAWNGSCHSQNKYGAAFAFFAHAPNNQKCDTTMQIKRDLHGRYLLCGGECQEKHSVGKVG